MMYRLLVSKISPASRTSDDQAGRVIVVNEAQSLRDLLIEAQDRHKNAGGKPASARYLAGLAKDAKHSIVGTTISGILNGTYKSQPSPETIKAIAFLAGVTEAAATTAAGVPIPGPPFADELPPGVDYLSAEKRKAVIGLLRVLIEDDVANATRQLGENQNEDSGTTSRSTASGSESSVPVGRRAAMKHQRPGLGLPAGRTEKLAGRSRTTGERPEDDGGLVQLVDGPSPLLPTGSTVTNIEKHRAGRGVPPYVDRAPGVDRSKWAAETSTGESMGARDDRLDEEHTDALNRDPEPDDDFNQDGPDE